MKTLNDIVAEKRRMADEIEDHANGEPNQFQRELIADLRAEADCIEAAWKRERKALAPKPDADWKATCAKCRDGDIEPDCEYYGEPDGCNSPIHGEHPTTEKSSFVGNAAAMREALELMNDLFDKGVICTSYANTPKEMEQIEELYQKAKAAISAPPRNCDVGSVKEQKERFKDFCKEGKLGRIDLGAYCAYDCPCRNSYDCKLAWAQMPYDEPDTNK